MREIGKYTGGVLADTFLSKFLFAKCRNSKFGFYRQRKKESDQKKQAASSF